MLWARNGDSDVVLHALLVVMFARIFAPNGGEGGCLNGIEDDAWQGSSSSVYRRRRVECNVAVLGQFFLRGIDVHGKGKLNRRPAAEVFGE